MSDKLQNEHLMLIDGYGLIYRSYFAFMNRPLTDAKGTNVSAVFGFFRSLFFLAREYGPDRITVAMDSRVPTFRHELYKEYKAQRDKTPKELHDQISVIESILEKAGVQILSVDGYEADDIIATIVKRCSDEKISCTIVTNDKDLLQLVDDENNITALRYEKKSYVRYTSETVNGQFRVQPSQVADYLSIVGDSSDNIPGIKGIGAKGAVDLLNKYGTLDAVFSNLENLSPANRKRVEESMDAALLSRELVALKYIDGICPERPGSTVESLHWDRAVEDFERIGANTLAEQAGAAAVVSSPAESIPDQQKGMYRAVESLEDLDEVIGRARSAGCFAFDVETDSLNEMQAKIAGCSISVQSGEAWYIPIFAGGSEILPLDDVLARLKALLEDASLICIGQNIKYDYKVLHRWGIQIRCTLFDTMVAAWLLDAGTGSYSMDSLADRFLGYKTVKYADVVSKGQTFLDVPLEQAVEYAAEDADITFRLYEYFSPLLMQRSLEKLMNDIEMPVLQILADMELSGIILLPDMLKEYSRELEEKLGIIEKKVYDLCGMEFNIHSTKQLQVVLFEKRGLKPVKKTKTGYSTDTSVLEVLALEDEVPHLILEHRVLSKLKSTYVDTLPNLINPDTGRIHTSYTQTGTATGRLSSRNPNLQNIPIRTEEGRKIRRAFIPREGCTYVSADYSQVELVILAHLADDPGLKEAFLKGRDVHRHTASLIFQVPLDEVTPEQRRAAKTINFGVMYGMSSFRLSQELSIPRKQADSFIAAYFDRYSGIKQFIDRVVKEAETTGEVKTLMGRTRTIPGITSRNRMEKLGAQRIAVNTPIQGTAADIMKLAMIRITDRLKREGLNGRMLLQIHDEIILEVPVDEIDLMKKILHEEMEQVVTLQVPLNVSIETGDSWGEMH